MKKFKTADCIIQGTLIISSVILNFLNDWKTNDDSFFLYYFVVGGWQLLSVLAHALASHKSGLRRLYLILLLFTFITGIVMTATGSVIAFLFILLYWSPVLALLYFTACIIETRKLNIVSGNTPAVA